MTDTRDPLDDLRDAWMNAEPREPGGDLGHETPETRGAVEWMQQAWAHLEVPAPVVPVARRPASRRFMRPLRYAAAAAIFIAVAFGLNWSPGPDDPGQATRAEPTVRILVATDERVEMESGPVRLILVTGAVARAE